MSQTLNPLMAGVDGVQLVSICPVPWPRDLAAWLVVSSASWSVDDTLRDIIANTRGLTWAQFFIVACSILPWCALVNVSAMTLFPEQNCFLSCYHLPSITALLSSFNLHPHLSPPLWLGDLPVTSQARWRTPSWVRWSPHREPSTCTCWWDSARCQRSSSPGCARSCWSRACWPSSVSRSPSTWWRHLSRSVNRRPRSSPSSACWPLVSTGERLHRWESWLLVVSWWWFGGGREDDRFGGRVGGVFSVVCVDDWLVEVDKLDFSIREIRKDFVGYRMYWSLRLGQYRRALL